MYVNPRSLARARAYFCDSIKFVPWTRTFAPRLWHFCILLSDTVTGMTTNTGTLSFFAWQHSPAASFPSDAITTPSFFLSIGNNCRAFSAPLSLKLKENPDFVQFEKCLCKWQKVRPKISRYVQLCFSQCIRKILTFLTLACFQACNRD